MAAIRIPSSEGDDFHLHHSHNQYILYRLSTNKRQNSIAMYKDEAFAIANALVDLIEQEKTTNE